MVSNRDTSMLLQLLQDLGLVLGPSGLGVLQQVEASSDEKEDGDDVDEDPELALGGLYLGHGDGVRNGAGARVFVLGTEFIKDPFVEAVDLQINWSITAKIGSTQS